MRRAPLDLLNVSAGQLVDLHISKRLTEDFIPSNKPQKAFSGTGNRLGSPIPSASTSSNAGDEIVPGSFTTGGSASAHRESEGMRFEVNQTLPTTSVQVRLADGTRRELVVAAFSY